MPRHLHRSFFHAGLTLVVLVGILGATPPASGGRTLQSPSAATVRVVSSDRTGITLEMTTPAVTAEPVTLAGQRYDALTIPGCTPAAEPGHPALPGKTVLLGVPPGAKLHVTATVLEVDTLPGTYRVAPAPQWVVREQEAVRWLEPVYAPDKALYAAKSPYPAEPADIVHTGYVRSQRVARLALTPFQYRPASGELCLIRRLRVRLSFSYADAAAQHQGIDRPEESSFEGILSRSLLNYETARAWRAVPRRLSSEAYRNQAGDPADNSLGLDTSLRSYSTSATVTLAPWSPPTPAWKVLVPAGRTGLYRLDRTDLQAAGLPVDTLDPRTLQLHNQGTEVAIHVAGQEDSSFDEGDYVEFYGQALDTIYTDTNVYWLTYGGAPGQRMTTRDGTPTDAPIPTVFTTTARIEEEHFYSHSVSFGEDHWFWKYMYAISPTHSVTEPLSEVCMGTIGLVATDTHTCTVGISLYGTTYNNAVNPDHHALVYLNDHLIDDAWWEDRMPYSVTVEVPATYLVGITNTFRVDMPADTGSSYDSIYVNGFTVEYQHPYRAVDDELAFTQNVSGTWQYRITGFSDPDVLAFDVTDPAHVVRITTAPILEISKVDNPDPVQAGDVLTYTLTVHNAGNDDATGVTITDVVPAHTTFRYASNGGTPVGGEIRWTNQTVNASDSLIVHFSVDVDSPLPDDTEIVNADYGVTCAQGVGASGDSVTTTVTSAPVLNITKAAAPDPIPAGEVLTYTLTVQNIGNADATGVTITDVVPANTTFRSAENGGSLDGDAVRWTGLVVNAGDSLVLRFSVTVENSLPDGTVLTNGDYGTGCAECVSIAGDAVTTTVTNEPYRLFLPLVAKSAAGTTIASSANNSSYLWRFQDTAADPTSYLVLAANRARKPLAIVPDTPSNLADPTHQADYVIIAHDDLYTSMLPLAAYWQTQGMTTTLVRVSDVYDEFSYGILDPTAIRDFLAYAYANWQSPQLAYVLLVGDSTYDYRHYTEFDPPLGIIPSHFLDTPYLGQTGSDNWFACVSGDDYLPDLYIGRLPARTAVEADRLVSKTLNYAQSPPGGTWNQDVLFVADNADYAGNFAAYSDDLVNNYLPPTYTPHKVYYGITHTTQQTATLAITSTVNDGCLLVNYIGHGAVFLWAHERLFYCYDSRCDFDELNNGGKLPFVVSMTCMDGYYIHSNPAFTSLAEHWLLKDSGGAVAAFAPTGMGTATGHHIMNQRLFTAIFTDTLALGPATTEAKLALGGSYRDLVETYHLFGDPALALHLP